MPLSLRRLGERLDRVAGGERAAVMINTGSKVGPCSIEILGWESTDRTARHRPQPRKRKRSSE